jgi:hypothetical protein
MNPLQACIKGVNLTGKVSIRPGRPTKELDPRKAAGMTLHYFRRTIGRTIIDDDPALGQERLFGHGIERFGDKTLLVMRWSDENVLHEG